jgi:hypothetical protein
LARSRPWLGVADHTFDAGKASPQRAFELVDELVNIADGAGRSPPRVRRARA